MTETINSQPVISPEPIQKSDKLKEMTEKILQKIILTHTHE
jgi:hypothetical protein